MNPVQHLLKKILEAQVSHPWLFLVVALLLVGLSILYTAVRLEFWTSHRAVISQENRLVQLAEVADQFSEFDTFVVAIENRDTRRSLDFLRALVPRIEADRQDFLQVFSRVDPERLKPWALLYAEKKELLSLRDNLKEHATFIRGFAQSPSLFNFYNQLNNEMAERMVGALFTGFLDTERPQHAEPMDLQFLVKVLREMKGGLEGHSPFTSPWRSFFADSRAEGESEQGYFWTENKRYLLFFVTPRQTTGDFASWQVPLAKLRRTIAEVKAGFPEISVGVTGQNALGEDEMDTALHDMSLATLLSLAGLAVLLVSFWRGVRRPLIEMIALLTALGVTFGFTTLFIGHLNILSVVFAPMLLGLGIDYGVHWFARYREEQRSNGASKEEALRTTMTRLGPGILLAGLTAALSFVPLVLTRFKGLAELGIICAIGLLMATLATLCLLPTLLVLFDRDDRRDSALRLQPVRPFLRVTRIDGIFLVAISAVGTVLSLWGGWQVQFDLNMLRLQSKRAESVIWEKKLMEDSQRSSMYGVILAHSLEEVEKKTKALKALPSVSEVQSILSLLPSGQEEKTGILSEIKPLLAGIGPLSNPKQPVDPEQLDHVLGRIRFKMLDSSVSQWGASRPLRTQMEEVKGLIDDIRRMFHNMDRLKLQGNLKAFESDLIKDLNAKFNLLRTGVEARPMRIEDLPKQLRERYVGQNDLYLVRVLPVQNIWEPDILKTFVRDLRSVDPDAVGDPVTLSIFTQAFRDASIKAALYAVVFISLLLIVTFRSLLSALLVLTPLVVGTSWTFGLMYLCGIDLNPANSIFLPLILGAGVEYGIIVVQRWRQRTGEGSERVLPSTTGIGVVIAGLTTTVGFGSLTISEHQGVHSLGLLSTIGSLSVLAAAVLFLPALLQIISDRRSVKNQAGYNHSAIADRSAEEEGSR